MNKYYIITLCCLIISNNGLAESVKKYWTSPLDRPWDFVEELDLLPDYVKAENFNAIRELGETFRSWSNVHRFRSRLGYQDARDKIRKVFDGFLDKRNSKAVLLMQGLVIPYYFGGQLYSPLQQLATDDAAREKALWCLKTMYPDWIAGDIVFTDTKTLHKAMARMPFKLQDTLITNVEEIIKANNRDIAKGTAVASPSQQRNTEVLAKRLQEMVQFNIDAEIFLAESKAERLPMTESETASQE